MLGSWDALGRLWPNLRSRGPALQVLEERPVVVQVTPSSILEHPDGHGFWYCDGRKRYATCSGVSWFRDDHLACVNVLGNSIQVYRFDRERHRLSLVQSVSGAPLMVKPENVSFSPDGSLVAVTDMGRGDLRVFRVEPDSNRISLVDGAHATAGDRTAHGVGFSRCGRFVAHTTVDKPGLIRVYRVEVEASQIRLAPFQVFVNDLYPLVPKGIDFASDRSRVAICYAPNVSRERVRDHRGRLEIRAFDPIRGIASKPISVSRRLHDVRCPDDVRFFDDDRCVVLTQQGDDSALVVSVDPATSALERATQTLRNPAAQLSFPHGAGVSKDGRYVAITNYGDDKFSVYRVARPRDSRAVGA